jgi:hypothetical protein
MLSDIPSSNVSCIAKDTKNKKSLFKKTEGNTFSANFYDLIENQFFVEAPVGGIAENIFKNVIEDFETFKEKKGSVDFAKYIKNKEFYDKLIQSIGDSYFRKTISFMISKMQQTNKE